MIIKDGNLQEGIPSFCLMAIYIKSLTCSHMLKSSDTIMNYTFTDLNGFIYFI